MTKYTYWERAVFDTRPPHKAPWHWDYGNEEGFSVMFPYEKLYSLSIGIRLFLRALSQEERHSWLADRAYFDAYRYYGSSAPGE